mmetsp:Transcript_81811/g.231887  ORF Transcript_81811/g.231887 Transcript_81811/m.231887 type:complete len:262 (+) Transcript_81811:72-857(+)
MPHLLIERLRSFAKLPSPLPRIRDSSVLVYSIEVLDILAAIIFVAGSVCFLPEYARNSYTYYEGCWLFIIGSALYGFICAVTLLEAMIADGVQSFEVWENLLYLLGSILFLVGSVMYVPTEQQAVVFHRSAYMSLEQLCEAARLMDHKFLATVYFIAGSVLFAFAAFTNALSQKRFDEWSCRMLSAVTSLYMAGSLLFAMGSVAFLPHMGCREPMVALGAWTFIVGSLFFLVGGVMSLWRTMWVFRLGKGECMSLTVHSAA